MSDTWPCGKEVQNALVARLFRHKRPIPIRQVACFDHNNQRTVWGRRILLGRSEGEFNLGITVGFGKYELSARPLENATVVRDALQRDRTIRPSLEIEELPGDVQIEVDLLPATTRPWNLCDKT